MREQRFSLIQAGSMDDPVLLRIQTRADRFSQLRVGRQDEKSFHRARSWACSGLGCRIETGFRDELGGGSVTFPLTSTASLFLPVLVGRFPMIVTDAR
jgi:hypothetical protein